MKIIPEFSDMDIRKIIDAEIIDAEYNDGLQQLAIELKCLLTWYNYATVKSQDNYTLLSDYLTIKKILIKVDDQWRQLHYRSLQEFQESTDGNTTTEGIPEIYKLEIGATDIVTALPGDFWLFPIPDAIYDMKVFYVQLPTALSGVGDISEIPSYAHKTACYYAAANLSLMVEDFERHVTLDKRYYFHLDTLKDAVGQKQLDRPYFVRDEMGYTDEG